MGETMMLNTDNAKEVGNVRIIPNSKGKSSHHEHAPGYECGRVHLSMADLLNLVVLWSIPIQKNDGFKVEADHVTVNADAHAHQNAFAFHHLPTSILLP